MVKIRNVLSLFDGICCGYLALKKAGIEFDNYYASEIDPKCVELAEKHHNIISLGDVANWQDWDLENIDLIMTLFLAGADPRAEDNYGYRAKTPKA